MMPQKQSKLKKRYCETITILIEDLQHHLSLKNYCTSALQSNYYD